MTALDLGGPIPRGRVLLEASAGTGKTYALTALIVRSIAEGLVNIDGLLVVTFTRSATREIRDRVRGGIDAARAALRTPSDSTAQWIRPLADGSAADRSKRLERLETAADDLDRAAVTTIHGFCQHALRQLGAHGGLPRGTSLEGGSSSCAISISRRSMSSSPRMSGSASRRSATDATPRSGLEPPLRADSVMLADGAEWRPLGPRAAQSLSRTSFLARF